MLKKFLLVAVVVVLSSLDRGTALGDDPAINQWRWPDALAKINALSASIGSTCRLWVEGYGSNSIRVWKRCGVNTTASGAKLIDYTIPHTISGAIAASGCPTGLGCIKVAKNADGTLLVSGGAGYPATGTLFSGWPGVVDGGGSITFTETDSARKNDISYSCTGAVLAGSTVNQLQGPFLVHSTLARYVRDTSTANNTISATCRAADALLIDFGSVAPDCDNTWLVTGKVNGRPVSSGSCDCIPFRHAIDSVTAGPVCAFIPITGDPGGYGDGGAGDLTVGQYRTGDGHTFTNEDLAKMGGAIPEVGSSGTGGMAEGTGATGTQGGTAPTTGTGTGAGGTVGAGGSGSAGAGGTPTPCTDPGCAGLEGGVIPAVPSFDSTLTPVTEQSWTDAITTWMGTSPFSGLFSSAAMTTSGATCVISGAGIKGGAISWDVCAIPGLTLFPPILAALAHLCAIFIVFRR